MKIVSLALAAAALITSMSAFADVRENGALRVRENGARLAPMAVEIVYTSIGSGIDQALKAKIGAMIQEQKNNNAVEKQSEQRWGMEGESTVCVQFYSFTAAYNFSKQLEVLVKSEGRYTQVSRKVKCGVETEIDPAE